MVPDELDPMDRQKLTPLFLYSPAHIAGLFLYPKGEKMTDNTQDLDDEETQVVYMPEFGDGPEDCAELSPLEIGGE